ncbi:MAG: ATP-binding protein [Nitrospirota bacterium]|nr:ATP-binding protein [Nitrospirota bacterium]
MGNIYKFAINKRMLVNLWDEGIAELTGVPASAAVGKKYFDVFPRVFFRDKDAVSHVIEKQKKLVLKEYVFNCLLYRVSADIVIEPVLTAKGMQGISVNISNVSSCSARDTEELQHFIAMGKRASTLAHGVRNPLNAIKGAVEFISRKFTHEEVLIEFARVMQEEISRLDSFISRFLTASVSDMGPSAVDINSLLKKIEVLISFQAHARNICSDFRYGTIPETMIDPFQLEQAVLNVINNAIEAIDSGGGLIVKTALDNSSGKDFILIEVSDDGPGMMRNRPLNTLLRGKNGKGFGLFITNEIMTSCGGRMDIKSRKGNGTSVRLYIPVMQLEG